jgi:hypothetical protein
MKAPLMQAYVAIGEGGLLKVGHSRNAQRRIFKLRGEFKAKGDVLKEMHICKHIEFYVEYRLIEFCSQTYQRHSGREWFIKGDFQRTAQVADELTKKWEKYRRPKPLSEAEREALRNQYIVEKAERDAAWKRRRAEVEARSRARNFQRNRAERAIQAIVNFAIGAQPA